MSTTNANDTGAIFLITETPDYLNGVMVQQDGCVAEYDAKESRRREKTKGALDLDD